LKPALSIRFLTFWNELQQLEVNFAPMQNILRLWTAATCDQLQDHYDEGDNQQDVNKAALHLEAEPKRRKNKQKTKV
jgi:hypothetical protein